MKEQDSTSNKLPPDRLYEALGAKLEQNARTYHRAILLGISIGGLFCLAGLTLMVLGVAGNIQWVLEARDLKARLTNASPGAALTTMGMIIVWRYKPKIKDELRLGPGRPTSHETSG